MPYRFCNDEKINTVGGYKIPKYVTDQNTLEILMDNIKKMDTEQQQTKVQNMILIIELVISFLLSMQEESNEYFYSIKFISEQLKLTTQNKLDYSTEMMIFSSLLYNYSPKGRLLRDSRNIILPKRLTLSTYMNPLIEQYDNNFLM